MVSKTDKLVLLGLAVAFLVVVATLVYFNTGDRANITGDAVAMGRISPNGKNAADPTGDVVYVGMDSGDTTPEIIRPVRKHVPLELSDDDILVSFRIDDITFETKQKEVLENALYLARKYGVTFDLAVIADRFDRKMDKDVFKIYGDNQDVFEVVAHHKSF